MDRVEWRRLHGIDKGRLREARLQAHYAAQWLARAARAYISPEPDDSHTSLIWNRDLDGLVTHPFKNGMRLSLQLNKLSLTLRDDGTTHIHSITLNGQSDLQVRQWLGEQFSSLDLDAGALDAAPPYEIPPYAIAQGGLYDDITLADALAELAAWFANAQILLDRIKSQVIGRKLAVSPVCCWPHHFDLATLITLAKRGADTKGYIGVGLSPGDNYYDEPYFYVSVYPKPDPAMLPTLPMFGHWHTHEFMAAVAPAHKILSAMDQKTETDEFLQCSVDVALRLLS
jgi:hypothetical protein